MSELIRREDAINAVEMFFKDAYIEDAEVHDLVYKINHIPAASTWHSVEEELPKEKGWYLVYAPTYRGGSSSGKESAGSVMFSKWSGKTWSIEVGYYERPNCVTHWMPIEPPKEGV